MSDTQVEPESGKESRRKCRTHGRMHALVHDVSVWIHGHRLAVTLSCTFAGLNIAMWIGFALAGRPLPLRSLRTSLQEFNLLHLLATLLLTRGILQLLVDTIALLVMFSIAETLLGRRRTLTAAFICTLAGTALGLLLCGGIAQLLQGTPVVGRIRFALSPLTLGVGAMMAASAFTRRLWRRRIRLIGYVSIIMVVMFSGNPGDYCLLAAAGFGHVLGALTSKRKTVRQLDDASAADPLHWQLSTSYETRRVFAAIALVLTLGPIIAISSPTHIGPLSSLGLIMSPASPDDGKLASCLAGMARTDCFFQFNLLRVSMPGAVLRSLLPTAVMLIMTWACIVAGVSPRGRSSSSGWGNPASRCCTISWRLCPTRRRGCVPCCCTARFRRASPTCCCQWCSPSPSPAPCTTSRSARTRGVCGEAARRSSSPWPSASRRIWASDCCAPAISGLRRHGMA